MLQESISCIPVMAMQELRRIALLYTRYTGLQRQWTSRLCTELTNLYSHVTSRDVPAVPPHIS